MNKTNPRSRTGIEPTAIFVRQAEFSNTCSETDDASGHQQPFTTGFDEPGAHWWEQSSDDIRSI